MLGRAMYYDFGVGHVMQPEFPNFDNLKFTVVAIESYMRALSEIGHGMSCHLIVQVPNSVADDLVKTLPETFFLRAGI